MSSISSLTTNYRNLDHQVNLDNYIKSNIETVNTTETLFQILFPHYKYSIHSITSADHLKNILNEHSVAVIERIKYEFNNCLNTKERTLYYFQQTSPQENLNIFSKNLIFKMTNIDSKTIENVKTIFNSIISKFSSSYYLTETRILNSILNEDQEYIYEVITSFSKESTSTEFKQKIINLLLKNNYVETANKLICSGYISFFNILELVFFSDETVSLHNRPIFIETLLKKYPTSHCLIFSIIYTYINANEDQKAKTFISEKILVFLNNPTDASHLSYFSFLSPKLVKTVVFILKNIQDSQKLSLFDTFINILSPNIITDMLKAIHADPTLKDLFKHPSKEFEKFLLKQLPHINSKWNTDFLETIGNFNTIEYSKNTTNKIKAKLKMLLKAFESEVNQTIEVRVQNFAYVSNLIINNNNFTNKRYNPKKLIENVKVNNDPVVLMAIKLKLFKEALILSNNGAISEKEKSGYFTELHELAKNTGHFYRPFHDHDVENELVLNYFNGSNYFRTWSEKNKLLFFKLFDYLVKMGYEINPKNKDLISAIALITDLDCAKTLIEKYQDKINIQDLINQSLISGNIELALHLYNGEEISITRDERILEHACVALANRDRSANQKLLLKLVKTIFDQIHSVEISESTSERIHQNIVIEYRQDSLDKALPHTLFEEYAHLFKFKPCKQIATLWMRDIQANRIKGYINLMSKIENIGKMLNNILQEALRQAIFKNNTDEIAEIISNIKHNKNLDSSYFIQIFLLKLSNDELSNHRIFDCLKQISPNFPNTYFQDKHFTHFLFNSYNKHSKDRTTLFQAIKYLIKNYDLNINSIYDRVSRETIFSFIVCRFKIDTSLIEELFKISSPQLDIRFNDDTTIFHQIVETHLKKLKYVKCEDEHQQFYSIFNFLSEKYPDWIYLIGEIKNPFTDSVLKTSPAVPLFIHSDKFDTEKLFYKRGSSDFDKRLAIDFIQEINTAFRGQKKSKMLPEILSILKNSNTTEMFKPSSSKEMVFHHLCRYTPLEQFFDTIPSMCQNYINVPDKSGMTAFEIALKYNNYPTVIFLLLNGGNPHVTLEGNKNLLHYQWQALNSSTYEKLSQYLPKSTSNEGLKINLYSTKYLLSLQDDDQLELPTQKIFSILKFNELINKKLNHFLKKYYQDLHQTIGINQTHNFLANILPAYELRDQAFRLYSLLIHCGLFNYVAPLIKDYNVLNLIPISEDLKLMLCYEPATFKFNGLKELETFQLKDPVEIFEEKFDTIKKAKIKISNAKKTILTRLNKIDKILEEDEKKADNDPSKISDLDRLINMSLRFCINNLLLLISNKGPNKIIDSLTKIQNACNLPLAESLKKCSELIGTIVAEMKVSKNSQDNYIIARLKEFSINQHITAAPNDETQRMYEYQKIMLAILSIQYVLEGKDDREKKEQTRILNDACGFCLTGMLSNFFQIFENLTGKKMTLSTREGFIRVLENFRSGIFDQFAAQCGRSSQSTHIVNHLLQKFGDSLGVSKSRSNKGDVYSEPTNDEYELFINSFYLKHQTNLLVYVIQQQFLEAYADNQDATTDYIKSITPKGSDEYEFLTQAVLIEGDQIQLSVYAALTILVDLEMYKVSDHASSFVEKLTSLSDSEDESSDDDILAILEKRPFTDTQESDLPPRKKQKL